MTEAHKLTQGKPERTGIIKLILIPHSMVTWWDLCSLRLLTTFLLIMNTERWKYVQDFCWRYWSSVLGGVRDWRNMMLFIIPFMDGLLSLLLEHSSVRFLMGTLLSIAYSLSICCACFTTLNIKVVSLHPETLQSDSLLRQQFYIKAMLLTLLFVFTDYNLTESILLNAAQTLYQHFKRLAKIFRTAFTKGRTEITQT